jgi:molecular chaperone HscB
MAEAKEAVGARNPGEGRPFDIAAELARLPAHGYDLDPRALRLEMLRRQATLHPDRNSGEVEMAAALSARVNKAYEVLANPQTRAEYIVSWSRTISASTPLGSITGTR